MIARMTTTLRRSAHLAVALVVACCIASAEPVITITPDHADGTYAPNALATWTVDVAGERSALTALPYTVKLDAQGVIASGTLNLSGGPQRISATRADPGALLVELMAMNKAKPLPVAMGGAVFAPERIAPSQPAPADFDAFWQAKLAELAAVPADPQVEPMSLEGIKNSDGMELWRVTMANIRNTRVRGLLAKPAKAGTYPALLVLNAAGVGRLDQAMMVGYARSGWLVLNVNAHDLPIDEPEAFYQALKAKELKDYMYIGNESRETSYFLRMFLGCVRGAEHLASRPEWDGRNLVVTGVSQGGLQSFATAALCPRVSAMLVNVPAGCDNHAPLAKPPRAIGWPYWMSNWGPKDRDPVKVAETSGYFDAINFAGRVRCPSLVAVALLDVAARPAGVIAACNAISAPKRLIVMPMSDHHGSGGAAAPYFTMFERTRTAIRQGKALPFLE